ncbi:MAG TPA: STAS domain-containing protein [Hyphomicrobium sp.]|nr:STAS domain-containing protein [Hyphomicrobium sp.]
MPRAKQKSAGAGRRRKDVPVKPHGSKAEAEAAMTAAEAVAVVVSCPDEAVATDTPLVDSDQAPPALMLPDCLDSSAAIEIKEMLLAQLGNSIVVDASQVRRVGVQSLQVLVAAARTWQRNGHGYRLENPSSEFLETIALVGLPREDLLLEGTHQ